MPLIVSLHVFHVGGPAAACIGHNRLLQQQLCTGCLEWDNCVVAPVETGAFYND